MSETPISATDLSPLRIAVFMTLAALGFAAIVGVIAVIDADHVISAVGRGLGTAAIVFVAGGTIVCGLACLVRERVEVLALAAVAAAGLAIDLFVLALWLDIDDDTYGKIAAVAFVWAFFGLIGLGLALAVQVRETLARVLYLGAMAAVVAAGLILTWLVVSGGSVTPTSAVGLEFLATSITDESLLRPLAVALVLLAALWFGALAASRLERS